MKTLTRVVAVLAFAVLYGVLLRHHVMSAGIHLDENTHLDRLRKSPVDFTESTDYYYAIDHPALSRWANRASLALQGVKIGEVPVVDKTRSRQWNIENGRAAPREPVMALRRSNVAVLTLALVCLYLVARRVVGGYVVPFALAAPLAIPPGIGRYVGGYILTDAYLCFFIALAALVWVLSHSSQRPGFWPRVVANGLVLGLAISTKLNAGLMLLAYMTYLTIILRGPRRWLMPLLAAAAAFAMFILVNPVMWHGGIPQWWRVISDTLSFRGKVMEMHAQMFGTAGLFARTAVLVPRWYLLPLFAVPVWYARREKWFLPLALWAGFLIAGTIVSVNQPLPRYRMPINVPLVTLTVLSTAVLARRLWEGRAAASGGSSAQKPAEGP